MNRIKKIAVSAKNNVAHHKAAYTFGALAIGVLVVQQKQRKWFYEFLEEKGIDPMEFYCPEYYEELQNS